MKLQFGSGGNILTGWQNYDSEMDIRKVPFPFQDNSAEMIFACHVMEHVSSGDAMRFLTDCYRILKPGGVIRICCPVIGQWLTRQHARDLTSNHGHEIILDEHLMRMLLWMAGFDHDKIRRTDRREMDGHFRVIGLDADNLETCRMEGTK